MQTLDDELLRVWTEMLTSLWVPRRKSPGRRPGLDTILKEYGPLVQRLWNEYAHDRRTVARYPLGQGRAAAAYTVGFHLPNVARTALGLRSFSARWIWESLRSAPDLTLLDLGCGTGAIAQGVAHHLGFGSKGEGGRQVILVDQRRAPLELAVPAMASLVSSDVQVRSMAWNITREAWTARVGVGECPVVVTMGYLLNEVLQFSPRVTHLLTQLELLGRRRRVLVVVVDSARHISAGPIMRFRDDLASRGYTALYPCPQGQAECPLLWSGRGDWCFSEWAWDRPPAQRRIDAALGVDRQQLAASFYVFASDAACREVRPRVDESSGGVLVGTPQDNRRKILKWLVCQPGRIQRVDRPMPRSGFSVQPARGSWVRADP